MEPNQTTQKSKPFDQIIQDPPIGSGPYKIGAFQWGKDITYVKNKNYWAKDLNVRKGHFNFDKITVKISFGSNAFPFNSDVNFGYWQFIFIGYRSFNFLCKGIVAHNNQ